MPDFFNDHGESPPSGWREAFAALPMETPPADGWDRLTRALAAPASRRSAMQRERRMSWTIGLASAAMLAVAAWSPLSRWLQDGTPETPQPTVAATEAPGLRGPAAPLRAEVATAPAAKPVAEEIRVASSEVSTPAPKTTHRKPARTAPVAVRRSRIESAPAAVSAVSSQVVQPDTAPLTASEKTDATVDPLQKLKTQSAQLEALVALARDERVANASELLSSELDAGIAAVDAALAQPDLADARKHELWQQRVDLLQQLAGVEATSRWLAAQGTSNDTALVSVY